MGLSKINPTNLNSWSGLEKKFKAEKRFDEENEDDELGNYNEYDDFYN